VSIAFVRECISVYGSEEIKKEIGKMVLPFTFIVAYEHIICFSPIT